MHEDIHIVTQDSELYPSLLREINDPPAQLYIRGNAALLLNNQLLAVVGSRKATSYGKQCVKHILPPVVEAGIPLVSGMAYGIDALAHRVCVDLKHPTIAVLGSGIDDASIYPRAHITLAQQILGVDGALVSEYPPGTAGYQSNFPERNRIIAGLCQATLIVQAAQRSGSLITARLALESNRDVCAVPGAITDPLSAGTNQLIKDGALPVTAPEDLLLLFGIEPHMTPHALGSDLTPEHQRVLGVLSHAPLHIDEITTVAALPPTRISSLLLELELTDRIINVGGMKYVRK